MRPPGRKLRATRATTDAAARAEIARLAGAQFDPEIVHTFLAVPVIEWLDVRRHFADPSPAG